MTFSVTKLQKHIKDPRLVYKLLNGVFVIYKRPSLHYNVMRETIIKNLCRDLNNMRDRPMLKYVGLEGETNKDMKVIVRNSFADHPLVVGPRYQEHYFKMAATKIMTPDISGVIVCGINEGTKLIHKLKTFKYPRFYKLKGMLGQATDTYFHTGKIVEKSTYKHVKRGHIDKICGSMQSAHQRKMFELCGVDIQSQAAYELAIKGPLRPADPNVPMIYTIKCVEFLPPVFTIEIVCINETYTYLMSIIHELGMQLHSTATCTHVSCIQDGLFSINDALLSKQWTLKDILYSMEKCRRILKNNNQLRPPKNPALVEPVTKEPSVPIEQYATA